MRLRNHGLPKIEQMNLDRRMVQDQERPTVGIHEKVHRCQSLRLPVPQSQSKSEFVRHRQVQLLAVLGGTVSSRSHCRTLSSSNYEEAITVLKKRFGNKQQLINKHMEALLSLPTVTSVYELRNLRQLYDKVESHVRSLKSIGVAASSYGNLLASILMKKIPSDLCLIVSRETVEDNWDLDSLLKILGKEFEAREREMASMNTTQPKKPTRDSSTAAALLSDTSLLCVFCDQSHYSTNCRVVTDCEKRKEQLLKAGRCSNSLKKGHLSKDCRSSRGCYNCGRRHH